MDENKKNIQCYTNEISLREILMVLWKRKKMILAFTLIVAILAAMLSMFVLPPVYETNLNIIISMPEVYNTRYGEYKLPITTNEQYINLIHSNDVLLNTINDLGFSTDEISISEFENRITVVKSDVRANTVQNIFTVKVSADNPDSSLEFAQSLYENYIEFLDVMVKKRTINYYINHFNVELRTLQNTLDIENNTLAKNEELLLQTPKTIDVQSNIEIQSPLNDNSNYIVPIETANPNYIKIESDIINNKQSIYSIESNINKNMEYLEELQVEKQAVSNYYKTGRTEKLATSVVGIVENNIYLASSPVAPTNKTSPNTALNIAIAVVLGVMTGVMAALIKEYLIKDTRAIK